MSAVLQFHVSNVQLMIARSIKLSPIKKKKKITKWVLKKNKKYIRNNMATQKELKMTRISLYITLHIIYHVHKQQE